MNRSMKTLALVLTVAVLAGFAVAGSAGGQGGSPFCFSPNSAIPDNNPAGTTDSQAIGNTFTITDLNVSLMINHTWVGDVTVTLSKTAGPGSPIGPISILTRPGNPASTFGCSGNNIATTLDDGNPDVEAQCAGAPPAIPAGPFGPSPGSLNGSFAGVDINGTWALNVFDSAGGDTGTVVQWCLITTPVPVDLMEFSIE